MTQGPLLESWSPFHGGCKFLSFSTTYLCVLDFPHVLQPNNISQQIVRRSEYENPSAIYQTRHQRNLQRQKTITLLTEFFEKYSFLNKNMFLLVYNVYYYLLMNQEIFLNFSVLVPKIVKIDRYKPHKQRFFGVLSNS